MNGQGLDWAFIRDIVWSQGIVDPCLDPTGIRFRRDEEGNVMDHDQFETDNPHAWTSRDRKPVSFDQMIGRINARPVHYQFPKILTPNQPSIFLS